MQYGEFQEKVKRSVEEYMGDCVRVRIKEVYKNNGIRLHGLVLMREGSNIAPTVYLEQFYKDYENGREFSDVIMEIFRYCRSDSPVCEMNMDFFTDYEKVKNGIFLKLVNREKNRELLEKVPYVPFLNLALVFYYSVVNEFIGNGSILICLEHLKTWGVDEKTLYQNAFENTREKMGIQLMDMREIICGLFREQILEDLKRNGGEREKNVTEEEIEDLVSEAKKVMIPPTSAQMYVLTNRMKNMGAVSMIYQEHLKPFAEKLRRNLFILPSSVHEVILVPDTGAESPAQLEKMVREVNSTQMDPEEILSDDVYYFDRETGKISLINGK